MDYPQRVVGDGVAANVGGIEERAEKGKRLSIRRDRINSTQQPTCHQESMTAEGTSAESMNVMGRNLGVLSVSWTGQ